MTDRFPSKLTVALTAVAAQWVSTMVVAQDYPPEPPLPVRMQLVAQAPAPVLIGPSLSGQAVPTPIAPSPDDLPPADPTLAVPDADVEAFARGPVHEAFADAYDLNPVTNEVIAQAPPAVVDELPPEQTPTGDNVQWISGYWNWDTEAKDYLWVSGVWRDVPPGRRWVPGYWSEVTGGYQWIGGFWADSQVQELSYVPEPPVSLEAGPNMPAPGEDYQWVPGNWAYASTGYQWSPGYYMPCEPDYMWVPCQYTYTPRGYVFVPGYRDYRFARRGILFSPVRFRRPLFAYGYGRPAFYRPRFTISMNNFMIHLFVRPRSRMFYFGDYYGNAYANIGFSPWYRRSFVNRRFHDPALSFYRWDSHRRGVDFDRSMASWHNRFESNSMIRPPRTFHDQDQFLARHRGDRTAELAVMSHRFEDIVKSPRDGGSFRQMDHKDIDIVRENFKVNRSLENARRQLENASRPGQPGDRGSGQIVDLRNKDGRDRENREGGPRGGLTPKIGGERTIEERGRIDKLKLTDLPEQIKERNRESITKMDRVRQEGGFSPRNRLPQGNPSDTNRPDITERGTEKGLPRGPQSTGSDRQNRTGKIDLAKPPSVVDRANLGTKDDTSGRPDLPKAIGPKDRSESATARQLDARQNMLERRQGLDRSGRERIAPTPDEVTGATPRTIDRAPFTPGTGSERVGRERNVTPRIDAPSEGVRSQPVERGSRVDRTPTVQTPQLIERQTPVERAPRQIERQVPVERVPRQIERQVPVERAPRQIERQVPVERAPRQIERQVPVERAPRQIERAPIQRQAPAERAPRNTGGGGGRRGRD